MLTVSANYSEDFGVTHSTDIQHMQQHGLYDPANEHDACGVGFVAHIKGEKSHAIVEQGLKILENLDHRGAVGADALMGDGAGLLIQGVEEDSVAAEKGFSVGDAILEVDNKPVSSAKAFEDAITAVKDSGRSTALIKAERNGAVRFIGLPLEQN